MLDETQRGAAEAFVSSYMALRAKEPWAREVSLDRATLVEKAAALLKELTWSGARPLVVDVGSGGGWAVKYLSWAEVIAIDLQDASTSDVLCVRADMTRLPLRPESVDGSLFAASIHYAPAEQVIREVARVLKPGGSIVVVDSPIYPTREMQASARRRSIEYYRSAGFPELIDRYHPIAANDLRDALLENRFRVDRFEAGSANRWLRRLTRRSPGTIVAATKMPLR